MVVFVLPLGGELVIVGQGIAVSSVAPWSGREGGGDESSGGGYSNVSGQRLEVWITSKSSTSSPRTR